MDALCDACVDAMFAHLRGTAACRGERWATDLAARRRAPWIPWPVDNGHVLELAAGRVKDLTRDPRLRALLAAELVAYAARRWNDYRPVFASASA